MKSIYTYTHLLQYINVVLVYLYLSITVYNTCTICLLKTNYITGISTNICWRKVPSKNKLISCSRDSVCTQQQIIAFIFHYEMPVPVKVCPFQLQPVGLSLSYCHWYSSIPYGLLVEIYIQKFIILPTLQLWYSLWCWGCCELSQFDSTCLGWVFRPPVNHSDLQHTKRPFLLYRSQDFVPLMHFASQWDVKYLFVALDHLNNLRITVIVKEINILVDHSS